MKNINVGKVLNDLVTETKNKDLVVKMPLRFANQNEFNLLLKNTERTYQFGLICLGFISSSMLYSKVDQRAAKIGEVYKGKPQEFITSMTNHLRSIDTSDRTVTLSHILAGLSTYDDMIDLESHIIKRLENSTRDLKHLYEVCDSILSCPEYTLIDTDEVTNPAFMSKVVVNKLHKLILTDYMNPKNKLSVYTTTVFTTRIGYHMGLLIKDNSKILELFVMRVILLLIAVKQSSLIFRSRINN